MNSHIASAVAANLPAKPESSGFSWKTFCKHLEMKLGSCIQWAASALILAEIALLLSAVVARYFFQSPLVWSDEVGSLLFLWLAVLGSVIAFYRGEHMRMTALVNKLSKTHRAYFESLAMAASFVFLALLVMPAYEFVREEMDIVTPALEISSAWRAAALPVGITLMALMALMRWVRLTQTVASSFKTLVLVLGGCIFMGLLSPLFKDLGYLNLIVFFVGITTVCVLSGLPIAVAFGFATLGFLYLTTRLPVTVMVGRMDEGMSHIILLSVPLFVFLGLLIEMTGMAQAMVAFLASLLGHVRGGLSYVLIGAMYLVSGISGSKVADMAAVAPVLFPEMRKRGAKDGELVAMLAASGAQTETIPPSLVLITIGSVTGVSIAALFAGGMLPGVVMGLCLCAWMGYRFRHEDMTHVSKSDWATIGKSLMVALPAIALPFFIRAAVVEGVATATEVSTLGILYATVVGLFLYRQFDWQRIQPMLVETASLSGAILFIIGTATGMAWSLTQSGFSSKLAEWFATLPGGVSVFLLATVLAFVILGSVLEGIPAIVLFGPLLFPIAKQVGVNEVHYAMVVVLSMGVGLFAPPFGVGYYAACAISKVDPQEGMKPMVGYAGALLVGLAIVTVVPWISTCFLKTA